MRNLLWQSVAWSEYDAIPYDIQLREDNISMMYPYITLGDGTEIVHSHIINDGDKQKVIVHFEKPVPDGFLDARCELPEYKWTENEGFSEEDIAFFTKFLEANAHLLFRYAAEGGINIA